MLALLDGVSELALAPVVAAEDFALAVGDVVGDGLDFGLDSVVRDHSVDDHHRFVLSHNEFPLVYRPENRHWLREGSD